MDAVDRLRKLNVFLDSVVVDVQFFEQCKTIEELHRAIRTRGLPMDGTQYLFFYAPKLMALQPELFDEAARVLDGFEIPPPIIQDYFRWGCHPGLKLSILHGKNYSWPVRKRFGKVASQFALDKMRDYLGFADTSE